MRWLRGIGAVLSHIAYPYRVLVIDEDGNLSERKSSVSEVWIMFTDAYREFAPKG